MQAAPAAPPLPSRPLEKPSLAYILALLPPVIAPGPAFHGQPATGTGVLGGIATDPVLEVSFYPGSFLSVL
ncbi:hypothetical protein MKK88_04985, partial [Methylobacterium sp. E-005]|uniref:hypothetical protein n=1 Tax=Methylobacterium sp. E-005 TaxID=2836549 RepID=UPI001FBBCFD2